MRKQYKKGPDEVRRDATIHLLSHEDKWPNWPILPMKNLDGRLDIVIPGGDLIIYEANMFNLPQDLTTLPHQTFKTTQDALLDGWRVD
jgi:hypothetical protein